MKGVGLASEVVWPELPTGDFPVVSGHKCVYMLQIIEPQIRLLYAVVKVRRPAPQPS